MTLRQGLRVHLRRLRGADLAAFQACRSDPDVGRWQGWSPMSDAAAAAFIEDMSGLPLWRPGEWSQIAIADAASDALIGDFGLHLTARADVVELGFTLARAAQGRGLAAEALALAGDLAFDANPQVHSLLAITDTRNDPALRLLDRGGWRRMATLPAVFRGERCFEQHFVLRRGARGAAPPPSIGPGDGA